MQNTKRTKKYYDEYWYKYNIKEQEKSNLRVYQQEALSFAFQRLKEHFGSLKNKKVLEIGPGKGYNLLQFAKLGANMIAIDISKNSLKLSKKLLDRHKLSGKSKFIQMDAHNLQFKKNEFDIIFLQTTLMHLDPLKVAKQCKRVLKKNGIFLFIEPSAHNLLIKFYRLFFSKFKETKPDYLTYEQVRKISKLFQAWEIKGFYLFSFFCLIFDENSLLYRLSSSISKHIEKILLTAFPALKKKTWLYVSINVK